MNRVNIKAILLDPALRRLMMAQSIMFIQATQGRDLTLEQAEQVYDQMLRERRRR